MVKEKKTELWLTAAALGLLAVIFIVGMLTEGFDVVDVGEVRQKVGAVSAFQVLCLALTGGAVGYIGGRSWKKRAGNGAGTKK